MCPQTSALSHVPAFAFSTSPAHCLLCSAQPADWFATAESKEYNYIPCYSDKEYVKGAVVAHTFETFNSNGDGGTHTEYFLGEITHPYKKVCWLQFPGEQLRSYPLKSKEYNRTWFFVKASAAGSDSEDDPERFYMNGDGDDRGMATDSEAELESDPVAAESADSGAESD